MRVAFLFGEDLMSDLVEQATGISGKQLTKVAMILASVWIAANSIVKGVLLVLGKNYLEMSDILLSGIAIASVYSPFYISIILDKWKEIKLAGK
jgi:hypothetical protein